MSDEILNEGDEGTIDPMELIPEKRGPGRPRKIVTPDAPTVHTGTGSGPGAMPGASSNDPVLLAVMQTVERLCDKLDTDPRDSATYELLQGILAQNAEALKETFKKENPRHPDISSYNPLGERDHPRPRLRRPVRFLGIPYDHDGLTRDEIELLNTFEISMETPDHRWRASVLRTMNGGEELHISVPFTSFDDLRGVQLVPLLKTILSGQKSHHGQTATDQVAALRDEIAELRALLLAKPTDQPAVA